MANHKNRLNQPLTITQRDALLKMVLRNQLSIMQQLAMITDMAMGVAPPKESMGNVGRQLTRGILNTDEVLRTLGYASEEPPAVADPIITNPTPAPANDGGTDDGA